MLVQGNFATLLIIPFSFYHLQSRITKIAKEVFCPCVYPPNSHPLMETLAYCSCVYEMLGGTTGIGGVALSLGNQEGIFRDLHSTPSLTGSHAQCAIGLKLYLTDKA